MPSSKYRVGQPSAGTNGELGQTCSGPRRSGRKTKLSEKAKEAAMAKSHSANIQNSYPTSRLGVSGTNKKATKSSLHENGQIQHVQSAPVLKLRINGVVPTPRSRQENSANIVQSIEGRSCLRDQQPRDWKARESIYDCTFVTGQGSEQSTDSENEGRCRRQNFASCIPPSDTAAIQILEEIRQELDYDDSYDEIRNSSSDGEDCNHESTSSGSSSTTISISGWRIPLTGEPTVRYTDDPVEYLLQVLDLVKLPPESQTAKRYFFERIIAHHKDYLKDPKHPLFCKKRWIEDWCKKNRKEPYEVEYIQLRDGVDYEEAERIRGRERIAHWFQRMARSEERKLRKAETRRRRAERRDAATLLMSLGAD